MSSKFLVLSSLGGNATRKPDVGEQRVVLGNGDVDRLVRSDLITLLLALRQLLLGSVEVTLVDVADLVWVVLGLLSGTVSLLLDGVSETIELLNLVSKLLLNDLGDDGAHDLQEKRLHKSEEKPVSYTHLTLPTKRIV